jgi:hypothetical protein
VEETEVKSHEVMTKQLPFSAADCDESPKISFVLGRLNLVFDYRCDSARRYAELVFDGAISVIFTPDSLVSEEMLDAYSKVCEYDNSVWLAQCRMESEQKWNPDLRHFRIYFDHYGCVDVIAKSWTLQS